MDFATRAISNSSAASDVYKRQTFTLKNGVKILQGTIKLNPVNNYCKTRQEVKKVVEVNPLFSL